MTHDTLWYLIGRGFGAGFCGARLRTAQFPFAILMRAQNPSKRLGAGAGVGGPAGCDLSAAGSVLAGLDRGCAAARCHLAGALSGDSATGLQGNDQARLLPATPWQGFVLGYVCGILWFAGTCYWIFDTMHRYGGLPIPAAALALILFCMYVGLYHGMFGLLLALVAGSKVKALDPTRDLSGFEDRRVRERRSGARSGRLRFFGSRWNWPGRGSPRFPGSFWDTRRRRILRSRGLRRSPAFMVSRLKSRS
jgi:hypothetical protein